MWTLSSAIRFVVLCLILWQTGCTTVETVRSLPMPDLSLGSVNSLHSEVGDLKHSVALMEKRFNENQKERQRSLNQLRALVKESSSAMAERERRIQDNLSALGANSPESVQRISTPASSPPPIQDEFAAMFRNAYSSYQRGDYTVAFERYQEIYEKAPSKTQKGQALFWAAESAYAAQDWDNAIRMFDKFRREFPTDPLLPSALLRTATAHAQKGDHDNSKRVLETLVSQYPQTQEAELARRRLADASGSWSVQIQSIEQGNGTSR